MPKYYVSSGDIEIARTSDSHKNAALAVFSEIEDSTIRQLGIITIVSEYGHDTTNDDDHVFLTSHILEETEKLENFKLKEFT